MQSDHGHQKILAYLLIFLFSAIAGSLFRFYPLIQINKARAENLARKDVYESIQKIIVQKISATHPFSDKSYQTELANHSFKRMLKENKGEVELLINETIEKRLGHDPKKAADFLFDPDSYFYYGLTENILATGTMGPRVGKEYFLNTLVQPPRGTWNAFTLHPYMGLYLYKVFSFFNREISLMTSIKCLGVIISVLSLIPFLFICYYLRFGFVPVLVGSIFFILSPFFLLRTTYGWYDTDPYNIFFPLTITTCLFIGLLKAKNTKGIIFYGLCATFLTYWYRFFWTGWIYFPTATLFSFPPVLFICWKICGFSDGKKVAILFLSYFFVPLFYLVSGSVDGSLVWNFTQIWNTFGKFLGSGNDIWPSLFLSVAELRPLAVTQASFLLFGNNFLIWLAMSGSVIYLIKSAREKNAGMIACSLFIFLFVLVFFVISLTAMRFLIFLTMPIVISFVMFLESMLNFLKRFAPRLFPGSSKRTILLKKVVLPLCMSAFVIMPFYTADKLCANIRPFYNETWDSVLRQVRQQTPESSIINTWWPPGHFITSVAKRMVVINGATQDSPRNYWMAAALLSTDEKLSKGILQMLDLGGSAVVELMMQSNRMRLDETINLVKQLLVSDKTAARQMLTSKGFAPTEINNIMRNLFLIPRPAYLMVYDRLIRDYPMLAYVASWDFNTPLNFKRTAFGLDLPFYKLSARNLNNLGQYIDSMNHKMPACSSEWSEVSRAGDIVRFQNNLYANLRTLECYIISAKENRYLPVKSVFTLADGHLKEIVAKEKEVLPYSAFLFKRYESYHCVIFDRSFCDTMLFKLLYLNGQGISYLKPAILAEDSKTKTTIKVYEIRWK